MRFFSKCSNPIQAEKTLFPDGENTLLSEATSGRTRRQQRHHGGVDGATAGAHRKLCRLLCVLRRGHEPADGPCVSSADVDTQNLSESLG